MIFLEFLTNYTIPIIYDSMVGLILVLFFLFIFRIKDSNIRILFFFLPLIKPFMIIIENININEICFKYIPFTLGMRFPDPLNFIPKLSKYELISFSKLDNLTLLIIIISIVVILIIRWVHLALFYKSLACEDKVGRKEIPEIYSIIDKHSKKTKVKAPDVSLSHKRFFIPFIVGIKNSTLVLSPNLMEKLNNEETETIIHHELSHIKRNDNLIGWIALILRDLNFFNPFGYISYYLIKSEQEKAADNLMVKYSNKSPREIARNILSSILKIIKIQDGSTKGNSLPSHSSSFSIKTNLNQKRIYNRIKNILKLNPDKIHSKIFPKILMYTLFLILFFIQITFIIIFNNIFIFLR